MYSAHYAMGHLSKTELNLTRFSTNPKFLLDLWKYLSELNLKQLEVLKKGNFLWSCVGKKYFAPEDPIYLYLTEWADVSKYDVIKSHMDMSSYTYVST